MSWVRWSVLVLLVLRPLTGWAEEPSKSPGGEATPSVAAPPADSAPMAPGAAPETPASVSAEPSAEVASPAVPSETPAASAGPAAPPVDVADLSLDELLDTPVSVASRTALSTREAPGIITVVSAEEIAALGARDLLDVFKWVAGFWPALDVQGVVGLGVRGNWGHEGKVLLLVDGQEQNEPLYSTLQLGAELPLEQVERIEIIRGPGSSIYGGFAELAVINVVTRGPGAAGARAEGQLGFSRAGSSTRQLSLQLARKSEKLPGLSYGLAVGAGEAARADVPYVDPHGSSADLGGGSLPGFLWLNGFVHYGGGRLRIIHQQQRLPSIDGYGDLLERVADQRFQRTSVELAWDWAVTEKLSLTPYVRLLAAVPWQVTDDESPVYYDKSVDRYRLGLLASWRPTDWLDGLAGLEGMHDVARLNTLTMRGFQVPFAGDRLEVTYENLAAFAQGIARTPIVDVTAGLRWELHSAAGVSLVPRAALTRVLGPAHVKLLFAQAFRAPGIENLNLNAQVRPERTTTFEGELGVKPTSWLFLAANVFDIHIRNPIVYGVDEGTGEEAYVNFTRTGTRGLEAEARALGTRGSARLSYSFYSFTGKNEVASYEVPGRPELALAFPAHKVSFLGELRPLEKVRASASLTWVSERFAVSLSDDPEAPPAPLRLAPVGLVGLAVTGEDVLMPGLSVGLGVRNLLDTRESYPQAFAGGHAPLPSMGREVFLRLGYGELRTAQ